MTDAPDLPTAPDPVGSTPATATPYAEPAEERSTRARDWRRLGRSRKAMAAGAVVAGLAIGGAGFGAGYAVGDDGAASTGTTTQTTTDGGDPGGPMGELDGDTAGRPGGPPGGQPGGPPGGGTQDQGGTTGQAPDFDGDGTESSSTTQQS